MMTTIIFTILRGYFSTKAQESFYKREVPPDLSRASTQHDIIYFFSQQDSVKLRTSRDVPDIISDLAKYRNEVQPHHIVSGMAKSRHARLSLFLRKNLKPLSL